MPKKKVVESDSDDDGDDEWQGSGDDSEEEAPKPKKQKSTASTASSAGSAGASSSKGKGKGKAKAPAISEADAEAAAAAAKLQDAACAADLVQTDRNPSYEYSVLHPSKELRQLAGKSSVDVVRSRGANSTKKKYLMLLPGRFAPVDGGTIGSIEKLDTPTPELLLHWPGKGKLRFAGSLVRPRARYLTMKQQAGSFHAEDVFENLVVFSEAQWLQSAAGAACRGRRLHPRS